jgi:hypothetical protein
MSLGSYIIELLVLLGVIVAIHYIAKSKHLRALFAPKWVKNMPECADFLNVEQCSKLETLRKEFDFPYDVFSLAVSASSEYGKIIIERDYKRIKKQYPNISEKQILTAMLQHENQVMEASGSKEVMTEMQITKAMSKINSLEDFCDFVVAIEHREQPMYYKNEICARIESIIKSR